MSNKQFTADVEAFERKANDAMLRVAKASLQEVVRSAQTPVAQGGNMPVDTGFLRNSLVSELEGGFPTEGSDSYVLSIAQLKLGDVIRFAWSAEYAIPRHYAVGVGQGGGLWRDLAAAQWEQIVRKNAGAVQ